jgi:hypothetical protein
MSTLGVLAHAPPLVQLLRVHPDVRVRALPQRPGMALYHIDFGRTLYLADTDDVLFVQLESPLTTLTSALELLQFLSSYGPPDQIKLVSVPGIAPEIPFDRLREPYAHLAVANSAEFDADVLARGFEAAVAAALRRCIKQELLVLYQYRGAVTGNRFFGREHQVQAVLRHPRTSYLVTGARMSGKTSLLLEVTRQLQNQYRALPASEAVGIAYLDCREAETVGGLFQAILLKLEERSSFARIERWAPPERWPDFFRYLRARAKRTPHRRLYLFMDEFDAVVDLEKRHGVNLTWQFRALHQANSQEKGFIQFVMAGSKDLAAAQKTLSTGLHNFVNTEHCKLDNFDLGTTRAVLEKPMQDAGIEVSDPQAVANDLLRETGGRPASVQYVCSQMVNRMLARKLPALTPGLLGEVVASQGYLEYYEATLRTNTDRLDRFAMAVGARQMDRKAGFTPADVYAEARRLNVPVEEADVFESLADLDNAGFIRPKDDGVRAPFVVAAPVLLQISRRRSLEQLAREIITLGRGRGPQ